MTETAQIQATIGAIGHTEISSSNLAATREFLSTVFDWTWEDMPGAAPYAMARIDGAPVAGLRPVAEGEAAPATTSYITVPNLADAIVAVQSAGGDIVVPETLVAGMGRFFWFQAPGGPVLAAWEADASISA